MARKDRRISVLVPEQRKDQYEALAARAGVPLATLAEALLSIGFDHITRAQEQQVARKGG